jgi:hypothetical protein
MLKILFIIFIINFRFNILRKLLLNFGKNIFVIIKNLQE